MIDLVGSTRRPAQIYYERWTAVPLTLERFTRLTSDLDGVVATTCDHDPIQSAQLCGAAASRERYRGPDRLAASRGAKNDFLPDPLPIQYQYDNVNE